MIPKIIHYCWLSGEKLPAFVEDCMKTWNALLPDYEIMLWNKERFDITSIAFVEEAAKAKKWASAADYIRLYAVYTHGGIYLDSDVIVKKSFNDLLNYDFFTAHEYWPESIEKYNTLSLINNDGTLKQPLLQRMYGMGIQAAIFGGIKGHPYLKDCLDWFNNSHFPTKADAGTAMPIAPDIYAYIAQKYGYRYKNELQHLNSNMIIFPSSYFPNSVGCNTNDSYAVHCCEGGWTNKSRTSVIHRVIVRNNLIRKLLGKKPFFENILASIDYKEHSNE